MIKLYSNKYRFIRQPPTALVYGINKLRYKNTAHPDKILYINPVSLRHYIMSKEVKEFIPGSIVGSDWDLNINSLNNSIKHNSLRQRYLEGVDWEETEIFDLYRKQFAEKNRKIKGCSNINDLIDHYYETVDKMFINIKKNGVLPPDQDGISSILVYINRKGEILMSYEGNHRLGISRLLDFNKLPVKVQARHIKWQFIRDNFEKELKRASAEKKLYLKYHPDLQDIRAGYEK